MNSLRCSVYQSGISIVAQNEAGRASKQKATLAAQKLNEKSRDIELKYLSGLVCPAEVLQQAAAHYDDDKLHEILRASADHEQEQMLYQQPGEDELTSSK